MKKLTLVGLHDDRHRILSRLMEIGAVNIVDAKIDEDLNEIFSKDIDKDDLLELDGKLQTLETAIQVLKPYDERKKPIFKVGKDLNHHDYMSIVLKRHEVLAAAKGICDVKSEMDFTRTGINRDNNSIVTLESWSALAVPLETESTPNTVVSNGMLPIAADIDAIKTKIEEEEIACELEVTGKDSDQVYITIYMHKDSEQQAMSVLKRNGFAQMSFSGLSGGVNENIELLKTDIVKKEKEVNEIENKLRELSQNLDNIEIVFDYYSIRREISVTEGDIAAGKRIFFLEGWVPAPLENSLIKEISSQWTVDISIREPEEGDDIPVLVHNGFIGDSVQDITAMYSLPSYQSVDPNPVMAPFFLLFFGLMLSDAGYGLVMAAACGMIYFFVKLEDSMKRFMKMGMLAGLATMFWGALFGSWFGNLIPVLSGNPKMDISIWFQPVLNPEYMLMWSLFFGVIHIYVGLFMKAANLVKQKKYLAVLFDVVSWYVFFTGAIFLVMPMVPGINMNLANALNPYGMYILGAGAVMLLLTQGRKSKSIAGKIVGGFAALYDLIQFMSDVLSYSRLLALGLATSVIASIVNEMGSQGGFTITGVIVFILVFAVGHSINFALNALGAYVHSSRLQYIEFFNKFFEGGGTPFRPFRRNTKYIRIKD